MPELPGWFRLLARARGVVLPTGLLLVVVAVVLSSPPTGVVAAAVLVGGTLVSLVPSAPTVPPVELHTPVRGRWQAINSPTGRVPSHGTHALGQTWAVDLVADPLDGSRPDFGDHAPFPANRLYPAYGADVLAPASGTVVRAHDRARDHRARSGWAAFAYLMIESVVRELLGVRTMLGNHVVLDTAVGHVVLAHLQRGSLTVAPGQQVEAGDRLGACGNSGNSSEPHVHLQVCDSPRLRVAAGVPFVLLGTTDDDGEPLTRLPATGGVLLSR